MKRIAFITDIHLAEQFPIDQGVNAKENFEMALADIKSKGITHIIFGGDIGDASAHSYFFDQLQPFSYELILGNHDKYVEVKNHFSKGDFAEALFYKKEDEHYKYLFLDSSTDEISHTQIEWLEKELHTTKQILIFNHHPILPIQTAVDKLYPLKNRDQVLTLLESSQQPITIFCGHYHTNDQQVRGAITQIATQALSFQLTKFTTAIDIDHRVFGYTMIDTTDSTIETTSINLSHQ
jgi:3',5'-cyclic-AMP phosphodiesterase